MSTGGVSCPNCHYVMTDDGSLAGMAVACPACGTQFQMPQAEQPSSSYFDFVGPPPLPSTKKRLAQVDRFSWSYIFDWKFEHYLTPWIVRGYWVLAVITAALVIGLLSVFVLVDMADITVPPTQSYSTSHAGPSYSQSSAPGAFELFLRRMMARFAFWAAGVIATLYTLLSIRLFCESVIVLFNIAASAKAIEKSLAARPLSGAG